MLITSFGNQKWTGIFQINLHHNLDWHAKLIQGCSGQPLSLTELNKEQTNHNKDITVFFADADFKMYQWRCLYVPVFADNTKQKRKDPMKWKKHFPSFNPVSMCLLFMYLLLCVEKILFVYFYIEIWSFLSSENIYNFLMTHSVLGGFLILLSHENAFLIFFRII